MRAPVLDIAAELDRLAALTTFELRGEWRKLHRRVPPARLSRDLLVRGLAYALQERALGGLPASVRRKLQTGTPAFSPPTMAPRRVSAKPGTLLVRDWHGETHTVRVLDDGVEWRGERYRSLSVVARAITGARWSGPRFFGLSGKADGADGG